MVVFSVCINVCFCSFPQLRGQCYDSNADPEIKITTILELGTPLEMIELLQTPWEKRFKVSKQHQGMFYQSLLDLILSAETPGGANGFLCCCHLWKTFGIISFLFFQNCIIFLFKKKSSPMINHQWL